MDANKVHPISGNERIQSLDLLRGFALLGILIMNIISFSNIGTGYLNPTIGAGIEGYNGWIHGFGHLFADMRFMSLFSILFGAGVLIFSDNIVKKGKVAWKYHYRRTFFLLIFGIIHAYLIWMGDILVAYAICGSIVFLLRKKSNRSLGILASIFFVIPIILSLLTYFFTPIEQLDEIFGFWTPSQEEITKEVNAYRGSYFDQMEPRIAGAIQLQTVFFFIEQFWRVMSMMLLGMILYRKGILSAQKSRSFYIRMVIIGFSLGLGLSGLGLFRAYDMNWMGAWYMNVGHHYNYVGSVLVAFGYIGVIMLLSQSTILEGLQSRLKAVGRMAFTNYILMSVYIIFRIY